MIAAPQIDAAYHVNPCHIIAWLTRGHVVPLLTLFFLYSKHVFTIVGLYYRSYDFHPVRKCSHGARFLVGSGVRYLGQRGLMNTRDESSSPYDPNE